MPLSFPRLLERQEPGDVLPFLGAQKPGTGRVDGSPQGHPEEDMQGDDAVEPPEHGSHHHAAPGGACGRSEHALKDLSP